MPSYTQCLDVAPYTLIFNAPSRQVAKLKPRPITKSDDSRFIRLAMLSTISSNFNTSRMLSVKHLMKEIFNQKISDTAELRHLGYNRLATLTQRNSVVAKCQPEHNQRQDLRGIRL